MNSTRWLQAIVLVLAAATPGPLFAQAGHPLTRSAEPLTRSASKPTTSHPAAPAPATDQLLVFVGSGSSASALAKQYGVTPLGSLVGNSNILRFQAPSVQAAATAANRMGSDSRVTHAYQIHNIQVSRRSFTPDDPFYFPGPDPGVNGVTSSTGDPNFPGQWHLRNQMPLGGDVNNAGLDIRATGPWSRDLTGTGVVIGIVDDAIEVGHPDLAPNNQPTLSQYFLPGGGMSADPSPPAGSASHHGTAVAGLAVGRGGNSQGITGAAPLAGLAGLRTDLNGVALANAYTWRNDAIRIKNHSYGAGSPYDATAAPLVAIMKTTATDPTNPVIHVVAAPNDRIILDAEGNYVAGGPMTDTNTDAFNNNRSVINVTALAGDGVWTEYSSFGANVFVTAPSSSVFSFAGVATTDRTGADGYNTLTTTGEYANRDYTRAFGFTSAAAPQVSGAIALAVQARNNLGLQTDVRVIKHLLARTSRIVDANDDFNAASFDSSDGGWRTNGAGFRFNQNFGFGLIDANALTLAATQFSGVTPQVVYTRTTTNVGAALPDATPQGVATPVSRSFTMSNSPGKLEEVEVTLNITHPFRGDIEAYLTSPSGFRSRLVFANGVDGDANIDWTFVSNAFWGEGVNGEWTITVVDFFNVDTGTWNSYSVTFYTGDLVPIPEPGAILGIAVAVLGLGVGYRRWRQNATVTPALAA